MIVISSRVRKDNQDEIANWMMINDVIISNLTEEMFAKWRSEGYEGIFPLVPKHFSMSKMYRNKNSHVTFVFTDEQWTMFLLKWC